MSPIFFKCYLRNYSSQRWGKSFLKCKREEQSPTSFQRIFKNDGIFVYLTQGPKFSFWGVLDVYPNWGGILGNLKEKNLSFKSLHDISSGDTKFSIFFKDKQHLNLRPLKLGNQRTLDKNSTFRSSLLVSYDA